MSRKKTPAIDPTIAPVQGVTKNGQPLSYNRAPAPDIAPWIGRLYATKVELPEDYTLACGLFNDTACIRIQLSGKWTAETAIGREAFGRAALFFGPQTRRMPVSVTGSFISVGLIIRPGASTVLRGPRIGDFLDRIVPVSAIASPSDKVLDMFSPDAEPEEWLAILEEVVRKRVRHMEPPAPDPVTVQFEEIAFSNPEMTVSDAAVRCGVERRKLERVISRDFGMPPKQVLRRARALDMASHLRGVADAEEGEQMALRYYDESHLIHEFTALFGMPPRQFVATPQPLLTLALETRQSRRLEALDRIKPGQTKPWE